MAMDRLEEIRARLAAATPGPWTAIQKTWRSRTSGHTWSAYGIEQSQEVYGDDAWAISYATDTGQIAQKDADLIAHAPADLAYLLAEVERLQGIMGILEEVGAERGADNH
jgi:hypothetical protein